MRAAYQQVALVEPLALSSLRPQLLQRPLKPRHLMRLLALAPMGTLSASSQSLSLALFSRLALRRSTKSTPGRIYLSLSLRRRLQYSR